MPLIIPAPQVEQTALQLPGAPQLSDNGLGAIAQGSGVAADQLRAQEIEQQKKRDATRVFEAESRLADAEREMRTAQQQRRGSNAYGVTDDVSSWWETEGAKISADLENETQRTLFAEALARRREISLNHFALHEANESNAAVNDATEARKVNAINYGAANFNDPEAVAQARTDILDAIGVQGRFNGIPPDQLEQMRVDALTKLHSNVIENMVDADPAAASAYFQANKDEIAGSVHDALRNKITATKDLVAAQRLADDIWSRGLSETEALAAVRKEAEGQTREHALALLRQQFNDQEAAVKRRQQATVEEARAAFNAGGIRALTPSQIATLERVAPSELRAMRSTTPQEQVQTNWDVYYGIIDMARKSPVEFRDDLDLYMLRADLNQVELDRLLKMQQDYRDNVPSSAMTLTQLLSSFNENVDKEQRGLFEREVWAAVEDEQKRLNRKLSGDEMRAIIDRQLMEVTIPRSWWFDRTAPLFSLTPEERAKMQVEYDAIPAADREELERDLKALGREASREAVVAVYRQFIAQGNR